jgi:hypothetical protein
MLPRTPSAQFSSRLSLGNKLSEKISNAYKGRPVQGVSHLTSGKPSLLADRPCLPPEPVAVLKLQYIQTAFDPHVKVFT